MRTGPLGMVVFLALVTSGTDAAAFCRMSTSQAPSGYDPTESGCWSAGTPIAWTAGRIPYAVASRASRQVDLADVTHAVHLAFDAWNRAACTGGAPDVTLYDSGPLVLSSSESCSAADCAASAPSRSIVFDDDAWPYPNSTSTLALTTVSFDVRAAEIFDAYIEVDTHDHRMTTRDPAPPDAYELQVILTHEAGHYIGLAHATNEAAVMYAYYQKGRTELTPDDVSAICQTYPPLPTSGMACSTGQPESHSLALAAFVFLAIGAARGGRRLTGPRTTAPGTSRGGRGASALAR